MLDLVETRERENKWWASGIILCVCVCAFVSAHFPVCVWALARVSDLFPGTPHQGLWDASQHKKESVFIRAQTHVLLDASRHLEWLPPPPLSSHSGRSWEELNSYRHTNLKAQKSDKMWQAPELLPFSASPFLSHSCFRSPLVEKKNPSSKPAFTTSVNPSQLQSLMIRSLINATGKERSYLKAENKPHT